LTFEKTLIYGNPNIGVYVYTNELFSFIPKDAPEKLERIVASSLQVPVYRITLCQSPLIGVFSSGNSKGLILSKLVTDEELSLIKKLVKEEVNVMVIRNVKESAIGNLILANDKAAIISPLLPRTLCREIQDVLDVEVIIRAISGFPLVGSVAVVSNKGLLVNPLIKEEEIEELGDIFGVKADVGTVNRGNIFLRSGIVVNSKGGIVGSETTGPELMRLHQVFFGD